MHVLLLDLGMELRGGQRQVYYLARELVRSGESVMVACPRNSALARLLEHEKLPLLPLPGHSPINPGLLASLALAVRLYRVDIVHTHDANAATVGALLKLFYGGRLRLLHSRRVSYPLRVGLRMKKYEIADAVVGVSREIADGMIASGLPAERVFAIHSGIDPSRYAPHVPHDGPFLFQCIGAFTPQKGYEVLIRATAVLAAQTDLPEWNVRLVGDGPLRGSIEQLAARLGVGDRVSFPGRRESVEVLPECDALLVPSVDGEGSSGTIKEGWACGIPVVASDLVSNRELVRDGENGLLAVTGDADSLAQAMRRCLLDSPLRERLVEGGRAALPEFTEKRMARQYMDLYRRLRPAS